MCDLDCCWTLNSNYYHQLWCVTLSLCPPPSPDGLKHLEEIKFNKCIYIEDTCLERLSSIENLQETLYMMELVSCGNVTDKGIIALHRLRWLCVLVKLSLVVKWERTKDKYLTAVMIKSMRSHRNLEYLFLSDLPGVVDKQKTVERLQTALPRLDITLDLDWLEWTALQLKTLILWETRKDQDPLECFSFHHSVQFIYCL